MKTGIFWPLIVVLANHVQPKEAKQTEKKPFVCVSLSAHVYNTSIGATSQGRWSAFFHVKEQHLSVPGLGRLASLVGKANSSSHFQFYYSVFIFFLSLVLWEGPVLLLRWYMEIYHLKMSLSKIITTVYSRLHLTNNLGMAEPCKEWISLINPWQVTLPGIEPGVYYAIMPATPH